MGGDRTGASGQPAGRRRLGSQACFARRDDTENAMFVFDILSALGTFFLGVGVLWFVSVYREKQ
jgi:hypothetical protein